MLSKLHSNIDDYSFTLLPAVNLKLGVACASGPTYLATPLTESMVFAVIVDVVS